MSRSRIALALLAAFATACLAPASRAQDRIALVIGNSAYRQAAPLRNPANDARSVAAALKSVGFEVQLAIDLPTAGFFAEVDRFSQQLNRRTVALFYYAGHGLQVNGMNFIVPVDATFDSARNEVSGLYPIDIVIARMEGKSEASIVILDACRNDAFGMDIRDTVSTGRSIKLRDGGQIRSVAKGFAEMQGAIGMLIAYSTQPGNVAFDGDGDNSPFTAALIRALPTPGLEIRQVLSRTRADVVIATGRQQVPWDHSSLTKDLYLRSPPSALSGPRPDRRIGLPPP